MAPHNTIDAAAAVEERGENVDYAEIVEDGWIKVHFNGNHSPVGANGLAKTALEYGFVWTGGMDDHIHLRDHANE